MNSSYRITDEQVANLHKLGNHLDALPEDYRHFDIGNFAFRPTSSLRRLIGPHEVCAAQMSECGSSACGIGHGPLIGLMPEPNEDWLDYGLRVFGAGMHYGVKRHESSLWDAVFCSAWSTKPNEKSHHALVRRLDAWLADNGYPARKVAA